MEYGEIIYSTIDKETGKEENVTNPRLLRSTMLDGEAQLIRQAQRGNAESFGELYDHYLPKIYRYIFAKVSHREHAEDIAHEVFLAAWKNLPGYRMRGFPFSSWLYRIARNEV